MSPPAEKGTGPPPRDPVERVSKPPENSRDQATSAQSQISPLDPSEVAAMLIRRAGELLEQAAQYLEGGE